MSYKEWLYEELVTAGIISEDAYSPSDSDFTASMLFSDAEIDESDFEQYHADFEAYCSSIGVDPIWDFDEEI